MGLLNTLPLQEEILTTQDQVSSSDEILALANLLDDERPTERLSRACAMLEHLTIDGLLAFPWAASLKNQRLSPREIDRLNTVKKLMNRRNLPAISRSCLSMPKHQQVIEYLQARIGSLRTEYMVVLYFSSSLKLLHEDFVTNHKPGFVELPPKIIIRTAILVGARRIIMAHNHPSGNTAASQADIMHSVETKRLGKDHDIELAASLVVSHEQVTWIHI